jgi:hypothetical protein
MIWCARCRSFRWGSSTSDFFSPVSFLREQIMQTCPSSHSPAETFHLRLSSCLYPPNRPAPKPAHLYPTPTTPPISHCIPYHTDSCAALQGASGRWREIE